MKAVLLEKPGPPDVLKLVDLPIPEPESGWVRIKIMAFGLNRSEMYTRQGHTPNFSYPRVLGIECAGVVDACPSGAFEKGPTSSRPHGRGWDERLMVDMPSTPAFLNVVSYRLLHSSPGKC